ncbi:MAG: hypothetical protein M0Z49_16985 [Chloroflexi bacterium]|nr:hypothetical protein [Chloroflexota bacterium]
MPPAAPRAPLDTPVTLPGAAPALSAAAANGVSVLAVAGRGPFDLEAYARVPAAACMYGVQPAPSIAMADALVGRTASAGHLPVAPAERDPAVHVRPPAPGRVAAPTETLR